VPLYPFAEHRAGSLRSALRSMAATPVSSGLTNRAAVYLSRTSSSFFALEHSLSLSLSSLSFKKRPAKKAAVVEVVEV